MWEALLLRHRMFDRVQTTQRGSEDLEPNCQRTAKDTRYENNTTTTTVSCTALAFKTKF
jgi:hypothetical protein